ncbi:transmembrane protein 272-like [Pempheris klunzingeri]|uniref:transmembrane protein 272-like n=1 Tax=Pempheris klunzingeri TaxID=3127111 RepID=UPI00397E9EC1
MSGSNRLPSIRRPPAPTGVCHQVILCILSIAQLAVGAVYQNDCPRQPYIPVYLLVSGAVPLLLGLLNILPCTAGFGNHCKAWSSLVSLFFFCWFIAGNVWIYSIYEPNYNKTTTSIDTYCDKTLYLFAFWTTNMTYILLGLMLFCMCCSCFLCGDE